MKRIRPLFCILLICVMLTGCSFNLATSTSDLISAVSPFGENAEIKKALDDYLGGGYILKNPSFGDYITSYNFYDLDNDGEDEAVAFYQTKDALNTVNMALIKKYDDVRNRHEAPADDSGAEDGTQLDAAGNEGGGELGLGTGGEGLQGPVF